MTRLVPPRLSTPTSSEHVSPRRGAGSKGPRQSRGRKLIIGIALVGVAALVATVVSTAYHHRPNSGSQPSGDVTLREVDGGPNYYARFNPTLPTDNDFFPVGVWFESVTGPEDVRRDADAGVNVYVELTSNSDLQLIEAADMFAVHGHVDDAGDETVGWLLADEADMWAGPGSGQWTGNYPGEGDVCVPEGSPCGFTVQETLLAGLPEDQRLRYANYGKGVLFWQSRGEATRFFNEYQDVVSADAYWFTDENICGPTEGGGLFAAGRRLSQDACHLAANYGMTVDHARSLVDPPGSKPVWAFVELGHPFSEDHWPTITPAQIRSAVWSSLIHGARGIVYFNHSFGGECVSQHVLRDPCYSATRRAVTALNRQVTELAPVLNAPVVEGITQIDGPVDATTKYLDGQLYLLAGANTATGGTARFSLQCVQDGNVTVIDESRKLRMTGGRFEDDFADGEAVHLYEIDAAPSCDLG